LWTNSDVLTHCSVAFDRKLLRLILAGKETFAAAMPRVTRIHLTEIHAAPQGDVRFPAFAPQQWRESAREVRVSEGLAHSYVTLDRKMP